MNKIVVLFLHYYLQSLSFQTFFQLGKLTNLKHLRLEHGGEIPDVGLGDALLNLKQ